MSHAIDTTPSAGNTLRAVQLFADEFPDGIPADLETAYTEALIILQKKAWVYYSILLNLKVVWTRAIPTAGTDGAFVYINPEFFTGKDVDTPSRRAFLLGHEVGHIILRHPQRGAFYSKRGFHSMHGNTRIAWDHRQYNMDADKVINADLIAHGLQRINCGIYDNKVTRDDLVDAVYVQSMLDRKREEELQPQSGDDGEPSDDGEQGQQAPGAGGDTPDESAEEQAGDQGDDDPDGEDEQQPQGSGHSDMDEHFEPRYEGTPEEQEAAAESDKAEVERMIDDAIDSHENEALDTGSAPDPGEGVKSASYRHNEDGIASDTDWRAEFNDIVVRAGSGGDVTWSRIHRRRYATLGVVSPTRLGVLDQIAFIIDISGSVSRSALQQALIELAHCIDSLQPSSGCLVMFTNTQVESVVEVFSGDELLELEIPSGGGTQLSVALDYMEEHGIEPDVTMCFTDGDFYMDEWKRLADADVAIVLDRHPWNSTRKYIKASGARVVTATEALAA